MIHVLLQLVVVMLMAGEPATHTSQLDISLSHRPTIDVSNGLRTVTFNTKVENHSSNLHYALSSTEFVLSGEHKSYQPSGEQWEAYLGPHAAYLFNLVYQVNKPGRYRLGTPFGQHFDLMIP